MASAFQKSGAREIELIVADAGVGFDERAARGCGLGLTSMTERLKLVNGELSIDSRPGIGTTVRARVPLDRAVDPTLLSSRAGGGG